MTCNRSICSSFTHNGALACCSADGILHVWNVKTGEQALQCSPITDFDADALTCLAWKVECFLNVKASGKTPKKKLKSQKNVKKTECAALGTASGEVLLCNCLDGEIVSKFSGGHNGRINCISWGNDGDFYTCSNEQHIVEWNVASPAHKCKWKTKKREIYSVCVGPHGKTILSAGKTIELWDLKTKTLIKKYAGQSSPVLQLSFVNIPSLSWHSSSPLQTLDGSYFLSASSKDSFICAWQIKNLKHKKTAASSFALPSTPRYFDVLSPQTHEKPIHLLAVTVDEEIVVFSQTLNGHPSKSKPVEPMLTIKIVNDDAIPLKIICAAFDRNSSTSVVTIAYGAPAKVAFEHVKLNDHSESQIVLIRNDPSKVDVEQGRMQLREVKQSNSTRSVTPPVEDHFMGAEKGQKRSSIVERELTLEERVEAMNEMESSSSDETPTPDLLSHFLSQGLQDNDSDILNKVLQHEDETLISETVRQIPTVSVIPFVRELTTRLYGSPDKCSIVLKWAKSTLCCHSGLLLMYHDEVSPLLNRLDHMMKNRTGILGSLSRLEGKLELILNQVLSKQNQAAEGAAQQSKALYVYEDSSDDEEMEATLVDLSDAMDDWEDFSDTEKRLNQHKTQEEGPGDDIMNEDS